MTVQEPVGTAERLLALAVEQLDERGEAGLRVTEICAAAGVTVTSLYHHFENREGLVEAAYAELYVRNLHEDLEAFRAQVANCKDVTEFRHMLSATLVAFQQPTRLEKRMRRMSILGSSYRRPALQVAISKAMDIFFESLASPLRDLQAKGWVRADLDTKSFSAWFMGQLMGQALSRLPGSTVDMEGWGVISRQAVFTMLFGDVPGTPAPD
jgi:AcrR family transcriptional regulator